MLLIYLLTCFLVLASCALQHLFQATCLGLTVPTWAKLGHATGWAHVLKGCTWRTFHVSDCAHTRSHVSSLSGKSRPSGWVRCVIFFFRCVIFVYHWYFLTWGAKAIHTAGREKWWQATWHPWRFTSPVTRRPIEAALRSGQELGPGVKVSRFKPRPHYSTTFITFCQQVT